MEPSAAVKSEPEPDHLVESVESGDDTEDEAQRELYKCPDCTKAYVEEAGLTAHRKKIHGFVQGPFACQHCGNVYSRKQDLERHLRADHLEPDNRQFQCEICKRRYKTQSTLQTHTSNFHPDGVAKAVYPCTECGKHFATKASLLRHRQRIHEQLGESGANQEKEQDNPAQPNQVPQRVRENLEDVTIQQSEETSRRVAPSLPTRQSAAEAGHRAPNQVSHQEQNTSIAADKSCDANDSLKHRLEFNFQGARVVLEDSVDGNRETSRVPSPSRGPSLPMSSSLDRKRKWSYSDRLAPLDQEAPTPESSSENDIVTDGLKRAYDKVLGESFQDNIRLKQDNAMLRKENEMLKKAMSKLQDENVEGNLTNNQEGEEIDDTAQVKAFEKDCSLARLSHESARARAQSEMPQAQDYRSMTHARMPPIVRHSPSQNSRLNSYQQRQYSQAPSQWTSPDYEATQGPTVSQAALLEPEYGGGLPEALRAPFSFSSWMNFPGGSQYRDYRG